MECKVTFAGTLIANRLGKRIALDARELQAMTSM